MSESDFFDAVYAQADGDEGSVPWQHAISRRFIADWLDAYAPTGHERVVVGAGLGDDAAALARKGLDVTAFDVSPTAVEWSASRHAELDVDWLVANLFELPAEWSEAFDLVVEVFTIQSIPPARQPAAADAIRRLLAENGTLVAVMLVHSGDSEPEGPPWPLHPTTLARLTEDLDESRRRTEALHGDTTGVLVELTRDRY